MFSKTALTFLALGALYVSALSVPVAREPSPEPEFQDLEARVSLKGVAKGLLGIGAAGSLVPLLAKARRETSDELFSREPNVEDFQDLMARVDFISDDLFSREPEDWL